MAKFDFNNSRYAKFFNSKLNTNFLSTFINEEGILFTNYRWWETQCRKDTFPTQTQLDGTATFTQKARTLEAARIADLRAPLGKGLLEDKKGIEMYTAAIPDLIAPSTHETAMERDYRKKMFEQFGNDADIVAAWVEEVQKKKDSLDAALNYMTGQVMTTAKIDYRGIGQGIQIPLHEALVPAANFVNAGAKVWSDPDCNILAQMAAIEKNFRDQWGFSGAMLWQIPKDMYINVFLQNKEVKELIASYKHYNEIAHTTAELPTQAAFERAFVDYDGVSPIEIVEERERNITNTGDSFIHGWAQNVAVLRPAGFACDLKYTQPIDQYVHQTYGAKGISKVFASIDGGVKTLINTTCDNGELQEWFTDMIMSACPALNEFPHHIIVDTATANA